MSLAEAGRLVADGCRLAIGGVAVYQHPMALVRELVRQGRRDLTVVGAVNGNDVDLLVDVAGNINSVCVGDYRRPKDLSGGQVTAAPTAAELLLLRQRVDPRGILLPRPA